MVDQRSVFEEKICSNNNFNVTLSEKVNISAFGEFPKSNKKICPYFSCLIEFKYLIKIRPL